MDARIDKLDPLLGRLDALLVSTTPGLNEGARGVVGRWRADAAATRFHLRREERTNRSSQTLLAVIGGTGTGKSTLVNRLLGGNLSAASFRRTFTNGPVAIAHSASDVPEEWLGVKHVAADAEDLPARGQAGALVVVNAPPSANEARGGAHRFPILIDTPDLDGDQPAHPAQADRVFRWADAVIFLVTPEKYQMTELLPYYRLAVRYAVPALYVMNKCEEAAVLEDYRTMLKDQAPASRVRDREAAQRAVAEPQTLNTDPPLFVVARDDAGYEPPAEANLAALKAALLEVRPAEGIPRAQGLQRRAADLLGRFHDQILAPLRDDRHEVDRLATALRSMEAQSPGIDVNPLTQSLQRRMQQRSILYLMGPQRIMDRVRQAPGLLARLPRFAWDYLKTGELAAGSLSPAGDGRSTEVPDFHSMLADQFAVLHSRIDDALRSSKAAERWLAPAAGESARESVADDRAAGNRDYRAAKIDPAEAGKIADEELGELRNWLEKRWNATPRDTRMLETLLKYLPGGTKLAKWSEAAPYLLTIVLVTHGAIFGHIDLLVIGGYSLATWLTERLSNEVASRTRATNMKIAERFTRLAHEQIERIAAWLDRQAPSTKTLDQLERIGHEASEVIG